MYQVMEPNSVPATTTWAELMDVLKWTRVMTASDGREL